MMARFPKEFIFGRYSLHRYANKLYSQRALTLGYRWKTLRLLRSEPFFLFARMDCYVSQPLWVRPENIAVFEEEQRTSPNRKKKTRFSLSTKQSRVLESTNHVRKRTTSHKFSDLLTSEKHFLPVSGRCLLWLRFSTSASKKNRPTKEPHSLLRWESKLPHQSPYITATSGLDLSAGKMSVGRILLRDFSSLIWWGERVGMVWTCVHLFINYTLTLHRVCVYIMLLLSSYFFFFVCSLLRWTIFKGKHCRALMKKSSA